MKMSPAGVFWLLTDLGLAALPMRAAEEPSVAEVVRMSPIKVTGGYFDYRLTFDHKSNRLKGFEITWVAPQLAKNGLRVGDLITMIDGTEVEGLLLDEVQRLLAGPAPGVEKIFSGFGKRGLLARKAEVTITLTGDLPKDATATESGK